MLRPITLAILLFLAAVAVAGSASPAPVDVVERTFTVSWNNTLLRVDVEYPAKVPANSSQEIRVRIEAVDMGGNWKVRIEVVTLEVVGTVISETVFPMKSLYYKGDAYSRVFILNFSDPGFRSIELGGQKSYTLRLSLQGTLWYSRDDKDRYSFQGETPIYVESPDIDLYVDVDVEGDLIEGEVVNVAVKVVNVGRSPAYRPDVRVECDGMSFQKPNMAALNLTLKPGEGFTLRFPAKLEDRGGWFVRAYVETVNDAGLNKTFTISRLLEVKGRSRVDLYVNCSKGDAVVWGWLKPPRLGATVSILASRDGVNWSELAAVDVDAAGYFKYGVKLREPGSYCFKAAWSGDEDYLGSESSVVRLNVSKTPVEIRLLTPTLASVEVPGRLNLTGIVTPAGLLENRSVLIMVGLGGSVWSPVGEARVVGGKFSFSLELPEDVGSDVLRVKAVWPGDSRTFDSESNVVSLTVQARGGLEWRWQVLAVMAAGLAAVILVVWYGKRKRV